MRPLILLFCAGCPKPQAPAPLAAPEAPPTPEPIVPPEPTYDVGCDPTHLVWLDWTQARSETRYERAELPIPAEVRNLQLSPELDYSEGRPGRRFELLVQRTGIGLDGAWPIDGCGGWDQVGIQLQIDGSTARFTTFGTLETPDRAVLVRGVVVGPPGVSVRRTMDLYGSVEGPAEPAGLEEGWEPVTLEPDSDRISEIFDPAFAAMDAEIDHGLKPKHGRTTFDWDQVVPLPPIPRPPKLPPTPTIDPEEIQAVFAEHQGELQACIDAMWQVHDRMGGTLPIYFTVVPGGQVHLLEIFDSYIMQAATKATWPSVQEQSARLGDCVAEAIWSWRMPEPQGGEALGRYELVIDPDAG